MTFCRSLLVLLACAAAASADDSIDDCVDLTPWSNVGSGPLTVETSLRYAAQVTAEEASQALPVQGEVTLAYTQQEIASGPLGTPRVVRRVDRITGAELRPEARLLVAEANIEGAKVVAAQGPLTRAELDVLQSAADPIDIDALLPGGEVRDGGTWNIEPAMVGRLMRITPGDVCEVVGIVSDITPTHARLRLAGAIEGSIDGAKVAIDLRGVALFDRGAGRLTKLNLAWKEKRELGPATPAMEASAKLNVAIEAATEESPLDADLIESVAKKALDDRLLVRVAAGGWTLLAERDWFVVAGDRRTTTLRRIEGDKIAAVTTIVADSPRKVSLPEFEGEVRHALGKDLSQIVKSQLTPDDGGVERLAVASIGKVDEQPVAWRHHHLAAAGAALSATTTLRVDDAGSADDTAVRRLIESVRPLTAQSETAAASAAAVRR
jgi:hypothetical protein